MIDDTLPNQPIHKVNSVIAILITVFSQCSNKLNYKQTNNRGNQSNSQTSPAVVVFVIVTQTNLAWPTAAARLGMRKEC